MILIFGLALVVGVAAIDLITLAAVLNARRPVPWMILTTVCLMAGIGIGYWSSFQYRYAWGKDEVLGFPIPVIIFQWENGAWVDYVGNPFFAFVGWFLVASAFLLPITFSLLLVWSYRRLRSASAKSPA
jgi:hypothetical protein